MRFGILTTNPVIDCALFAWLLAQMLKTIISFILLRQFSPALLLSSGGMPSSHSALVTAGTTAIGKIYGIQGPVFALAALFSCVVMYDACNVRRSAGDTAKLVNLLLEHVEKLTAEEFAENLKEVMGHTPLQVLAGAVLGISIGLLVQN